MRLDWAWADGAAGLARPNPRAATVAKPAASTRGGEERQI